MSQLLQQYLWFSHKITLVRLGSAKTTAEKQKGSRQLCPPIFQRDVETTSSKADHYLRPIYPSAGINLGESGQCRLFDWSLGPGITTTTSSHTKIFRTKWPSWTLSSPKPPAEKQKGSRQTWGVKRREDRAQSSQDITRVRGGTEKCTTKHQSKTTICRSYRWVTQTSQSSNAMLRPRQARPTTTEGPCPSIPVQISILASQVSSRILLSSNFKRMGQSHSKMDSSKSALGQGFTRISLFLWCTKSFYTEPSPLRLYSPRTL